MIYVYVCIYIYMYISIYGGCSVALFGYRKIMLDYQCFIVDFKW